MGTRRDGGVEREDVTRWAEDFGALCRQTAGHFPRRDSRANAEGYLRGLLGRMERKNGWQMAEYLGRATPDAVQFFLDRAVWDADAVRDELQRYAREHLTGPKDGGVLVVDETGFLKKGVKSVGVQRQYSGTAGRTENCQVGVFLALSTARGRALVDRALYLPKSWCDDPARCRAAKVPEDVAFATKPRLAETMLARAWANGFAPAWVLADAVYGSDSAFRRFLEEHDQPYVVAVRSAQRLWVEFRQRRLDALARELPARAWHRWSVGDGAKGPRVYDWAAASFGSLTEGGLRRWVLFRRSVAKPEELAYYLCLAPAEAKARDLAVAAGRRWSIECCFEAAKQETGLDEYEVRSWHGWHRHITLSLLALAFLTVVRSKANGGGRGKRGAGSWCR